MAGQDDIIDRLAVQVRLQKEMTLAIHQEILESHSAIDSIQEKMKKTRAEMKSICKQTKKLL